MARKNYSEEFRHQTVDVYESTLGAVVRGKLVVPGGNGAFKGTVLHRGHAVGTWTRPTKKAEPITVTPFGDLPAPVVSALPRLTAALPS